jgi:DNA-directed RNA polymerase specialized sigma24 family protein
VVLRYYLDMPEQEIAEQLNGPAGTVRWWLFAAKQRLAKLLSHQSEAHEPHRASSSGVHKSGEQQ